MADQALFSGLIATGGTGAIVALWLLDKVAGGYVSDKARKLLSRDKSATPAADRLAIEISILKAEIANLERVTQWVIGERDYYQKLSERTSRSLAELRARQRPVMPRATDAAERVKYVPPRSPLQNRIPCQDESGGDSASL